MIGGELFDFIVDQKKFNEKTAAIVFKQMMSGVAYCHNHKIVHKDLKPENVLLSQADDPNQIKIIDFGTSQHFRDHEKMHQKQGTVYYIAPEVLKKNYDEKCDIWSAGVILYVMLCGYPPFNHKNDEVIYQKIEQGKYEFKEKDWSKISKDAKTLIE